MMGWVFYEYFKMQQFRSLRNICLLAIMLAISGALATYKNLTRSEIIFLNIPGTRAMVVTKGERAVVLYDRCEKANEKIGYVLKPFLGERGIKKTDVIQLSDSLRISDGNLCVVGNMVFYKGATIVIQPPESTAQKSTSRGLFADLVWVGTVKSGIDHSFDFRRAGLYFIMHQMRLKRW